MENTARAERNVVPQGFDRKNSLLSALSTAFGRMKANRDMRRLEAMPDYMLRDLGIARSEIRSVVRFGRDKARPR